MLSDIKLKVAESNDAMKLAVAESNAAMEKKVDGLDAKMDQVLRHLGVPLVVIHSDV